MFYSIPKKLKALKVSKAYNASKALKVSKALKAIKKLGRPSLRWSPNVFLRSSDDSIFQRSTGYSRTKTRLA